MTTMHHHVYEVIDKVMTDRGYIKHPSHIGGHIEINYLSQGGGICIPQEAIIQVLSELEKDRERLP